MTQKIPLNQLAALISEMYDKVGHRHTYCKLRTFPKLIKHDRVEKEKTGNLITLSETFKHPDGVEIVSIVKENEGMYSFNLDYQNKVNTNLDKAGFEKNFETGSLPWGEWVEGSRTLILHKGEYYVRMYPNKETFLANLTEAKYFFVYSDGREVEMTKEEVEIAKPAFFPVEKEKKTLLEGSFDEAKPPVNTVKLESIQEIRMNGEVYIVK
jgi:hypothetical protein